MGDPEHMLLIVDDEPDMCWALENLLRKSGFRAMKALSAAESLALMANHKFRLALLDAKLPDMDGLELAAQMKSIDPSISIVMISGFFYTDDNVMQQAISEGLISRFIAKPFRHEDILQGIEGTLSSNRRQDESKTNSRSKE